MDDTSSHAESGDAPPATLGGLARGYEHYLEKRGEALAADWDRTTVVLDTNVLLNLYRSPDETRDELLGALEAIADSLFMPAQVQREFWRNRDSVLRENAGLDNVANELRKMLREAKNSLTRLGQGKIGAAPAKDLIDELEATLEGVIRAASNHQPSFNWRTALSASEQDTVLSRLTALYDGKVGPKYNDTAEFAAAVAEASSRFRRRVPPGYMDAQKEDNEEKGSGDYLLWRQTIAEAQRSGRNVVFVTQDAKEDWWRLDARNEPINARFELVEEMRREAGVAVRLVLTADFIRVLGETTGSPVSERTVDQVDELAAVGTKKAEEIEAGADWNRAMLGVLLDRLRENGYEDRALVIERGIASRDVPLTRADVLEVLGLPADAKLTGFTRPIATATKQLVDEGVLPLVAEPALWPGYDGPGKAVRFSTPVLVEPRRSEEERT